MSATLTASPALPPANFDTDRICIRGRTLRLDELFRPDLLLGPEVPVLAARMRTAAPCAHLVVDRWFDPNLLELVREEFDLYPAEQWRVYQTARERTRRSLAGGRLGPASMLYFGIVNSAPFLDLISAISGVEHPIADPTLFGGGLHETRRGGRFGIHRDFDRHLQTGLENRMVFITYLNRGWQPAWGGALELWDRDSKACVTKVEPEFGHSILMCHGPDNFHGHPDPLNTPEDQPRRSVATYYYTNPAANTELGHRNGSVFLMPTAIDRAKRIARSALPPALWALAVRLARRR